MAPRGPPRSDADVDRAIAIHFDGDASLYAEFADACATQLAADVAIGQSACAEGDLNRLRRLAHDLCSALLVLGHTAANARAARVEQCALAGNLAGAQAAWRALKPSLQRIGHFRQG